MTVPTELDNRFRETAGRSGLLDAAYDLVESPVGTLFLGASSEGLCRISYDPEPERELERLARAHGPRVLRSTRPLDRCRTELDEYFAGDRRAFELELDLRAIPDFYRLVLGELARVPYGELTTYGTLAARAVGSVMNRNPLPIVLPCHRVVGSTGKLVGYAGGLERKEQLLRLEGALL